MGQKELISGTCWIAVKNGTLEVIIDTYRIYLQHLANLTRDNSYPAKERNKFAGWYKKCRSTYSLSGLFEFRCYSQQNCCQKLSKTKIWTWLMS